MAQSNKRFSESPYKRNSKRRRTLSSMRESQHRALPAYFQLEYEEDVLNALESIETDVMLGKPIHWKKLLPAIRRMELSSETAPNCLNFAKALLGLFERYQCKDIRVISDVFAVLLFITESYHEPQEIDFERVLIYPYGKGDRGIDFVREAVTSANVGFLKLQLKFGMEMMSPCVSDCVFLIDTLLSTWRINSNDDITEDESTENGIITGFRITETCEEAIEKKLSCKFNPESMKRLHLVLRVLDMVIATKLSRPDCTEHYAEWYRLLFDSTPAAFVTSVEVKASLEKCLPVSCSSLISRITQDFKNTLPELAKVPQPRSLKHLSRTQVRRSLRQNLNLPSGVSLLPLPKILKQYIMLDDNGDYSVIIRLFASLTPGELCIQNKNCTSPFQKEMIA